MKNRSQLERQIKKRVAFKAHLVTYVSVITFLWVVGIVSGSIYRNMWPVYPMFSWGIALVLHYFSAYQKYSEWVGRELEREGHQLPPQYSDDDDDADDAFELKPPKDFKQKESRPLDSDFI